MANARQETAVVKILKEEFAKNNSIKRICMESGLQAFNDLATTCRIFDKFPCLLPKDCINNFSERFISLLKQIPRTCRTPEDVNKFPQNLKKQIESLELEIALVGCTELLGENGQIEPGLASLLGGQWRQPKTQMQIYGVLCGFVGAINLVLMINMHKAIPAEQHQACTLLLDYASKNYARCVLSALQASRKVFDPESLKSLKVSDSVVKEAFRTLLSLPEEQPALTAFLVTAAAGTLVAGSIFAVKMLTAASGESESTLRSGPR